MSKKHTTPNWQSRLCWIICWLKVFHSCTLQECLPYFRFRSSVYFVRFALSFAARRNLNFPLIMVKVKRKKSHFLCKKKKQFWPNCIGFGEFAVKCFWHVSANSPNGEFAVHLSTTIFKLEPLNFMIMFLKISFSRN